MKKLLTSIAIIATLFAPSFAYGAIALDSSIDGGYGVSGGKTYSYTNNGDYMLTCTFGANTGADTVLSAVWNGTSMTKIASVLTPTDVRYITMWGLANPATGTHNMVINVSSGDTYGQTISYTGVKQTGQPEVSTTTGNGSTNSVTTTFTTLSDNNWTVLCARAAFLPPPVAGTGSTQRQANGIYGQGLFDSNGPITPAGSTSMTVTASGATPYSTIMVSLAPPSTPSTVTRRQTMVIQPN